MQLKKKHLHIYSHDAILINYLLLLRLETYVDLYRVNNRE